MIYMRRYRGNGFIRLRRRIKKAMLNLESAINRVHSHWITNLVEGEKAKNDERSRRTGRKFQICMKVNKRGAKKMSLLQ